jgi:hypothetical protein
MPFPETWLIDGPKTATITLVLAHGAGQPKDSVFMDSIARLIAAGGVRVVRFDFPYMAERARSGRQRPPDREPALLECWRGVIAELDAQGVPRRSLVIGGKSMGGRMASLIADEAGVAGLVCLGYPFHPPGRPERLRVAHLQAIRTSTLICQGARDLFGRPDEVARYRLSSLVRVSWIGDGDHSFKPTKTSGRTEAQNLGLAVDEVLAFIAGLADK